MVVFFKNVIVGAGPAGIQMAYYLQQANEPYVILEKSDHMGAFFTTFPRKGKLISVNKRYCGETASSEFKLRFDWNSLLNDGGDPEFRFTKYSEDVFPSTMCLRAYLQDFADTYGVSQHVAFNCAVTKISRSADATADFEITTTGETYQCQRLFYGAGVVPKDIPEYLTILASEFNAKLYTYKNFPMDDDGDSFKNKHVCVVGTGNAGFEAAEYINKYSASIAICGPAKVAWRQHYPGFLRSNNMSLLDTFFLKINNVMYNPPENSPFGEKTNAFFGQVNMHLQNELIQWSKRGNGIDAIVYCGGFRFNDAPFDESVIPQVEKGFPVLTSGYESVNVPGLYFIGTLMQSHDYKKGSSGFIHGFRYNIRYLARTLFEQITPQRMSYEQCIEHMIERINNSSCMQLRYEYFGDCCVFLENGEIDYYEDVRVDFAQQRCFERSWTVRLGFARDFDWSFYQQEYLHPRDSHNCAFLHPIIDYVNGEKEYEFHIIESPWVQFVDPTVQIAPLKLYWDFAVTKRTDSQALRKEILAMKINTCDLRHPEVRERMGIEPNKCTTCTAITKK